MSRAQIMNETAHACREDISGDGDSMRAVRSTLGVSVRTGQHTLRHGIIINRLQVIKKLVTGGYGY